MDRQSTCTDLFYILVVTYCANDKGKNICILYIATSFKQQAHKIKLLLFAEPTLSVVYSFTIR